MNLSITTPSILFPAISLLMLAYTNRFLALSQLIRLLHRDYHTRKSKKTLDQINHIRFRVFLVRFMQASGALSIIFCTLSIFSILLESSTAGLICFILSLFFFLASMVSSLIEILMSTRALNILLSDIEENS